MTPTTHPRFAALPPNPDVVIIGAGAAGIAAARDCVAAGLAVAVIEARDRVGGRAVTVELAGHAVDLGAHWLHAGAINPLVALGRVRGEPLRSASGASRLLYVDRHRATAAERADFEAAWAQAERAYAAFEGPDRSFAEVLPPLGRWRRAIESTEILLGGRPLAETSFADQPGDELYADNQFIAGGYGAYLARLAEGLPIRTGCAARRIDWSGAGVRVETEAGTLAAKAAIVTVPATVLQASGPRFEPALPQATAQALARFAVGTYEHVVLHWPGAPFRGADRFVSLLGGPFGSIGLLSRIDGSDLHYMELNHEMAEAIGGGSAGAFALEALAQVFDRADLADCRVLTATDWRGDPLALGSWGVLPVGAAPARAMLQQPVGDRIWFAGEALAGPQCSTVGGAWSHGVRVAAAMAATLPRWRPL